MLHACAYAIPLHTDGARTPLMKIPDTPLITLCVDRCRGVTTFRQRRQLPPRFFRPLFRRVARGVSWLPGNPPTQELWAGLINAYALCYASTIPLCVPLETCVAHHALRAPCRKSCFQLVAPDAKYRVAKNFRGCKISRNRL